MNWGLREFKIKIVEKFTKLKNFNLMKYLLIKKEKSFLSEIEQNEDLIKYHKQQIIIDEAHVVATQSEIAILTKAIKELEVDVKKVVKVINLYIV